MAPKNYAKLAAAGYAGIKAGKSRDQIVSSKDVLPGFDDRGPLTTRALAGTYDELIA